MLSPVGWPNANNLHQGLCALSNCCEIGGVLSSSSATLSPRRVTEVGVVLKQQRFIFNIFFLILGMLHPGPSLLATTRDIEGFDPDNKYLAESREVYWADNIRNEFTQDPDKGMETCLRGLLQVYGGSLEHLGKKTKASPDPKFQALINDFFRLKADLAVHRMARGYLLMQKDFDQAAAAQSSDAMAKHIRKIKNATDDSQFATASLYYQAVLQDSAEMAGVFNKEDGAGLDLLRTDFNKLFPDDKYLIQTEDITLINFLNREYRRISGKTNHGYFNKIIYSTYMAYSPEEKNKTWNIEGSLKAIALHQETLQIEISKKLKEVLQFLRDDEHFNCNQAGINHDQMVAFIDRPEVSCRIFNELPFAKGRGLLLPTNIKDAIKGLTYFGADALEPIPVDYYEKDNYWVRRGVESDVRSELASEVIPTPNVVSPDAITPTTEPEPNPEPAPEFFSSPILASTPESTFTPQPTLVLAPSPEPKPVPASTAEPALEPEPPLKLGLTPITFDFAKNTHLGTIQIPGEYSPVNLKCEMVDHAEIPCTILTQNSTTSSYLISFPLQAQALYPLSVIVSGGYNDKQYISSDPVAFAFPTEVSLQVQGTIEGSKIKLIAKPTPKVEGQLPNGAICQWKLGEKIIDGQTELEIIVDKPADEIHPTYSCEYGIKQGETFIPLAIASTKLNLSDDLLKVQLQFQDLPEEKVKVIASISEADQIVPPDQLNYTWTPVGNPCSPPSEDCRIFAKSAVPQKIYVIAIKKEDPSKEGIGEAEIPPKNKEPQPKIELKSEVKDTNVEIVATLTGLPEDAVLKWYRIKGKKPETTEKKAENGEETQAFEATESPTPTPTPTPSQTPIPDTEASISPSPITDSPLPSPSATASPSTIAPTTGPELETTPELLICTGLSCAVIRKDTDDKVYAETISPIEKGPITSNQVAIPKLIKKPKPKLEDPEEDEENGDDAEDNTNRPQNKFIPNNPQTGPPAVRPHTEGNGRQYKKLW